MARNDIRTDGRPIPLTHHSARGKVQRNSGNFTRGSQLLTHELLMWFTAAALAKDQMLSQFSGRVADSGEGRWTVEAAMEEAVPAVVLTAALFARYRSRVEHTFADQVLSAMRFGFGGHVEIPQ